MPTNTNARIFVLERAGLLDDVGENVVDGNSKHWGNEDQLRTLRACRTNKFERLIPFVPRPARIWANIKAPSSTYKEVFSLLIRTQESSYLRGHLPRAFGWRWWKRRCVQSIEEASVNFGRFALADQTTQIRKVDSVCTETSEDLSQHQGTV